MSRTPPFAAPSAPAPPAPPCRSDPDGWIIDVGIGYAQAAAQIRSAVAGCQFCRNNTPASYAACIKLPRSFLAPLSVTAAKVVTSSQRLVDPDRYIAVTLRSIKPPSEDTLAAAAH